MASVAFRKTTKLTKTKTFIGLENSSGLYTRTTTTFDENLVGNFCFSSNGFLFFFFDFHLFQMH